MILASINIIFFYPNLNLLFCISCDSLAKKIEPSFAKKFGSDKLELGFTNNGNINVFCITTEYIKGYILSNF